MWHFAKLCGRDDEKHEWQYVLLKEWIFSTHATPFLPNWQEGWRVNHM